MALSRRGRSSRRGLLAVLLATTLVPGLLLGCGAGRSGTGRGGSSAATSAEASRPAPNAPALGPDQAEVIVPRRARTIPVPRAFLGLSTEYTTLVLAERHARLFERVLSFLHVPGDGRFVVRIGGNTADHAVFDKSAQRLPPWAFPVTAALVRHTVSVFNALDMRAVLDLDTILGRAGRSGAFMRALYSLVQGSAGRLKAFEIGNEPDIYNRDQWQGGLLDNPHPTVEKAKLPPLPKSITAASYAKLYLAWARALLAAAPKVPLWAPALADEQDHLSWIQTLLHSPHPGLRVISAHIYPYAACAKPGQPNYPTVQNLLSENATAGMAKTIGPVLRLAHKAGYTVRLTEINSVTCGGLKGVSDTFSTALWAPDALFELMRAGVEGVNLHAREQSINCPFFFNRQGLQTHPLLYGLISFARMLGPHARLVSVRLRSGRSLHLKVWAVGQGAGTDNTLKLLLINKGQKRAAIHLYLPTNGQASVARLLAPSASSTSGVTFAGQRLDHRAQWQGEQQLETVRRTPSGYVVRVPRESAALLTVALAPGTLAPPRGKSGGPTPLFGYE